MDELIDKPLHLLSGEQINMFINLFEKIRKVDSMRVILRFVAHENTYRLSLQMMHPDEDYEPLLGYIYGNTISEMMAKLGAFKIPKIVVNSEHVTQDQIVSFFNLLGRTAPSVEYSVIDCPVCSSPTNFILACGHALCPHCSYRVSCCTLCRADLEEDLPMDDD